MDAWDRHAKWHASDWEAGLLGLGPTTHLHLPPHPLTPPPLAVVAVKVWRTPPGAHSRGATAARRDVGLARLPVSIQRHSAGNACGLCKQCRHFTTSLARRSWRSEGSMGSKWHRAGALTRRAARCLPTGTKLHRSKGGKTTATLQNRHSCLLAFFTGPPAACRSAVSIPLLWIGCRRTDILPGRDSDAQHLALKRSCVDYLRSIPPRGRAHARCAIRLWLSSVYCVTRARTRRGTNAGAVCSGNGAALSRAVRVIITLRALLRPDANTGGRTGRKKERITARRRRTAHHLQT